MSRPRRLPGSGGFGLSRLTVGRCPACGKFWYRSRKDARKAADSKHPGHKLQPYICPAREGFWHFGHERPIHERGKRKPPARG